MRRVLIWVYLAGAVLVVIGVFLQAFSITAYIRGAGSGALDMHQAVGSVTNILEVVTFLGALIGFWGSWTRVGFAFALPVIGTIQLFAIGDTDTSGGWANGVHGLLALVVLVLAGMLTHDGMRALGLRAGPRAT